MNKYKLSKLTLLLIVLLASIFRLYRLGSYPALNADEAAIGYNAYSLIETGRDEHGNLWPIHFQSFGDYKPGLYFYLVVPFVKFMGLNEWAVRFPGAMFSIATVVVIYLFVKQLFRDEVLAQVAALFLAISPWHIHYSRGGWEVSVATFLILTGIWLFIKALKTSELKFYIISIVSFALALYSYHAARVVVPLLGLGLLVIYRKKIKDNLKIVSIAAIVGILLLVPLALDLTKGNVLSRVAGVGLFADTGPLARVDEQRSEHTDFTSFSAKLKHNKPVNYGLAFLENWGEHFWGEFIFLSGDDIQRNKVPETGQMHIFQIIFLIAGFVAIAKKPDGWGVIVLWLVVAPLAAALTFQSPHALRSQNMIIPLVIISAYGALFLGKKILTLVKNKKILGFIFIMFAILVSWSFARYLHMYWIHLSKEYPFSSQHGAKELASFISGVEGNYQRIFVTDRYDQPYILFLFYNKYPPARFQNDHGLTERDEFGFSTVASFDKYHFGAINFDKLRPEYPNSLIIGTGAEIPDEANVIKEIYFPNGNTAFEVVAN